MSEFSRRQFVALASSAAAGVWLTATRSEILAAGLHAAQATKFETLTPEYFRRLGREIPGARLERMAATAHAPSMERPEAFDALVVPFLAEHA